MWWKWQCALDRDKLTSIQNQNLVKENENARVKVKQEKILLCDDFFWLCSLFNCVVEKKTNCLCHFAMIYWFERACACALVHRIRHSIDIDKSFEKREIKMTERNNRHIYHSRVSPSPGKGATPAYTLCPMNDPDLMMPGSSVLSIPLSAITLPTKNTTKDATGL